VIVGLGYRLWLMPRYAGWEESDYGNLAMVRGVLDGGFVHFDMNHMPGYYAVAAAVLAIVGDTVVAARATSLIAGVVALGLAVRLAEQLGGRQAAWWTGALLVFQTEFALYAATSLREPLYAAFILGALCCLLRERLGWAGVLAGLAFLVRMDGALVMAPVLIWHASARGGGARRVLRAVGPLVAIILLWALYCRVDHGTFAFWSHSVQVNVDTGLGAEAESPGSWWLAGAKVAGTLGAWVLPWRIGWGIWAGAILGIGSMLLRGQVAQRTAALTALCLTGVWLGMGFVAQHDPSHNLYWKWLHPLVPVLIPVGVVGLLRVSARLNRVGGPILGGLFVLVCIGQAWRGYHTETTRQRELSESLYRPQLALAQWIETEVSVETALLLDNIPACWIRRRPNQRSMTSWFDVPTDGSETDFAAWLFAEDIQYVLWFGEDWTQAPRVAPFLAKGGRWHMAGVTLVEVDREDDYGWIFYAREGAVRP
jgi:4-amino-4-deoxy-L-arabinose transferase-like glycosyltransferase